MADVERTIQWIIIVMKYFTVYIIKYIVNKSELFMGKFLTIKDNYW